MGKISQKPNNDFCPQTLFLYGTYDEKGNLDHKIFEIAMDIVKISGK